MRLPIPLLAAILLAAPPVAAEVFTGKGGLYFSLSRGSLTSPADADLSVTTRGVAAKYGVKRSSREGDFDALEVSVLGEPYDLKDAAGGKWRMWIRTAVDNVIEIELIRVRRLAVTGDRVYRPVAVTIEGMQAEPTFSQLTLLADGTYRLGHAHGKYDFDETGVSLSGTASQWGRASYTVNGDGLTFRFIRGRLLYEVKYEQLVNVAER